MSDEKKEIHYQDVVVESSLGTSYIGISKLTGKKIKEIIGYLSTEFGDVTFQVSRLIFEDDTEMGFEGEHDFPYLVDYRSMPQPNFDDETLERLVKEDPDYTPDEDESE